MRKKQIEEELAYYRSLENALVPAQKRVYKLREALTKATCTQEDCSANFAAAVVATKDATRIREEAFTALHDADKEVETIKKGALTEEQEAAAVRYAAGTSSSPNAAVLF